MEKIRSSIAGVFKYPEAKAAMKAMHPGENYSFEAEPSNQFDPRAIAIYVWTSGPSISADPGKGGAIETADLAAKRIKCGYIPMILTARLTADRVIAIVKGEKFDAIEISVKDAADE